MRCLLCGDALVASTRSKVPRVCWRCALFGGGVFLRFVEAAIAAAGDVEAFHVGAVPRPRRRRRRRAAPPAIAAALSTLGLRPGATWPAVRDAYKRRALEAHPDHGGDADTMARINLAFALLRRRYERREHAA